MCNGNQVAAAEALEAGGALLTALTFAQGLNEKLLNARDLTSIASFLWSCDFYREFEAEREVRA